MPTVYTTGSWRPFEGQVQPFLDRWTEFAAWSSGFPGAGQAVLARDVRDEARFVSFIGWDTMDAMRDWKASPEFKERMGAVQQHIDKFAPTEIDVVAECEGGKPL